jgi:peptide/nickel transport system permease protein
MSAVTTGSEVPAESGGAKISTSAASWRQVLGLLARRPLAVMGAGVLTVMVIIAIAGPALAPHGINDVDVDNILEGPSGAHWFGTDQLGRDVLSRTLVAARASLRVSAVSVGLALIVGVALGLIAGYYGRGLDAVVMQCMDVLFAFPAILLAIALVAVIGPGTGGAMIAIAVVYTPIFARLTRASVLSVREAVYVRASISIGSPDRYVIAVHVLPNVAAPIIVQASLSLGFAILAEAALSFLGLGIQPPQPSWGYMLFDARGFLEQAWWIGFFPGLAILLTVLSFNLIGDSLRDVLDPRRRSQLQGGKR